MSMRPSSAGYRRIGPGSQLPRQGRPTSANSGRYNPTPTRRSPSPAAVRDTPEGRLKAEHAALCHRLVELWGILEIPPQRRQAAFAAMPAGVSVLIHPTGEHLMFLRSLVDELQSRLDWRTQEERSLLIPLDMHNSSIQSIPSSSSQYPSYHYAGSPMSLTSLHARSSSRPSSAAQTRGTAAATPPLVSSGSASSHPPQQQQHRPRMNTSLQSRNGDDDDDGEYETVIEADPRPSAATVLPSSHVVGPAMSPIPPPTPAPLLANSARQALALAAEVEGPASSHRQEPTVAASANSRSSTDAVAAPRVVSRLRDAVLLDSSGLSSDLLNHTQPAVVVAEEHELHSTDNHKVAKPGNPSTTTTNNNNNNPQRRQDPYDVETQKQQQQQHHHEQQQHYRQIQWSSDPRARRLVEDEERTRHHLAVEATRTIDKWHLAHLHWLLQNMESQIKPRPSPPPQTTVKPPLTAVAAPQAIVAPEPEPEAIVAPEPEPQAIISCQPEPQAIVAPEPEPQAIVAPEPEPQAIISCQPEPQAIVAPEPEPQAIVAPEPEPQAIVAPEPEPQAIVAPEPEPQAIVAPEPELKALSARAPQASVEGDDLAPPLPPPVPFESMPAEEQQAVKDVMKEFAEFLVLK